MGLIFGKISVKNPKYKVVASGEGYDIIEYGANMVAEVNYDLVESKGGGFMILADYIGTVGLPQNAKGSDKGERIGMTAPILSYEAGDQQPDKIAMTTPVLAEERPAEVGGKGKKGPKVMQFVLPSKYTNLADVSRPIDPCMLVKGVEARKYGVADDKLVDQKLVWLKQALQEVGYKAIGQHILAQYNPPWTIPFLRTNEVMLLVE